METLYIPDEELRLYILQKTMPCDPEVSPKWDLCGWAHVPSRNEDAQVKTATLILRIRLSWAQMKAEHIPGSYQELGKVKVESRMLWVQFTNWLYIPLLSIFQWTNLKGQSPAISTSLDVSMLNSSKIRSQEDCMTSWFVREDNIGSWVYVSSQFTRVLRRQVITKSVPQEFQGWLW